MHRSFSNKNLQISLLSIYLYTEPLSNASHKVVIRSRKFQTIRKFGTIIMKMKKKRGVNHPHLSSIRQDL
jgi:hypothetical protein